MDGIEPHWQEIRTMVLDSSNQFPPKEPLALDLKKGSPFQKQLMDIFELTNTLTQEQVDIAKFWDCNPYVTHHKGHSMFATKKDYSRRTLDWNYSHCYPPSKKFLRRNH
jgi:hypothetical protein